MRVHVGGILSHAATVRIAALLTSSFMPERLTGMAVARLRWPSDGPICGRRGDAGRPLHADATARANAIVDARVSARGYLGHKQSLAQQTTHQHTAQLL